jgi:transposase-like protein
MDIHKNARLTPHGRERMVNMVLLGGQTPKAVSEAVGVCPRTLRKWIERFQAEGLAGLQDRSSRPDRLRQPTPQVTIDRIEALRRQRLTGKAIAAETGVSPATVSRVLKRLPWNLLSHPGAISATGLASSSTSTSKSSVSSTGSATGSPATAPARATVAALVGSSSTSR